MDKVSGLLEILSGFGKKICQHGRKIAQIGTTRSMNKSSVSRRNSKTIVNWSGDIDGSSVPKGYHRTGTMFRSNSSLNDDDDVPDRAVNHIPRVADDSTNVKLKKLENQLSGLRQEIHKDLQKQLDEKFGEKPFDETKKELQMDEIREELKNQTQRAVQQLVEENKASFREIRREMKRINRKH